MRPHGACYWVENVDISRMILRSTGTANVNNGARAVWLGKRVVRRSLGRILNRGNLQQIDY